AAQLLSCIYRRVPIPFLHHILPYKRCGIAEFGCELAAFRLEHIANDDPRSFCGEQASLGCALSACSATDEYDFFFEAVHFVLYLLEEHWCYGSCDAYGGQASTIFSSGAGLVFLHVRGVGAPVRPAQKGLPMPDDINN